MFRLLFAERQHEQKTRARARACWIRLDKTLACWVSLSYVELHTNYGGIRVTPKLVDETGSFTRGGFLRHPVNVRPKLVPHTAEMRPKLAPHKQ